VLIVPADGDTGSGATATATLNSLGHIVAVTVTNSSPGAVTSVNGATGAVVTTNLYAIGSYVWGRPTSNVSNYSADNTLAGSSIYSGGMPFLWNGGDWVWLGQGASTAGAPTLVNTGSWRCMSPTIEKTGNVSGALWVRYA
jgi:hypothetical protein